MTSRLDIEPSTRNRAARATEMPAFRPMRTIAAGQALARPGMTA